MPRLIALVVSIGLADSINPATVGPALYLAVREPRRAARRSVLEFTAAVFAVYLISGLVIVLGPGALVLSVLPHPSREAAHALEIGAGAALVGAACLLWLRRDRLAARAGRLDGANRGHRTIVLGAVITAVELPTAFPYFAALAAIIGSGFDISHQLVLLVLFDCCFVAPLVAIAAALTLSRWPVARQLARARERLQAQWPAFLAGIASVAGLVVALVGVSGLAD